MRVLPEFETHHYWQEYLKELEIVCPFCKAKEVWREGGSGDYYLGSLYVCAGCSCWFYFSESSVGKEVPYRELVNQLRSGKSNKPSTRMGS